MEQLIISVEKLKDEGSDLFKANPNDNEIVKQAIDKYTKVVKDISDLK